MEAAITTLIIASAILALIGLGVAFGHLYERWPFVLRLIWDPAQALDLRDERDEPDHGKILPAIVMLVALAFHGFGIPMPWWALLIVGSLSYGYGAWRTLLKSGIFSGKWSTEDKTITQRIFVSKERDAEEGIDPA